MTVLELRNVSKTYGAGPTEVRALRGIGLAVEPGTMVAVMGPSGSGKSTLPTIAGSLEDPTDGEVLVAGTALSGLRRGVRARLRRRVIGYVFQDYHLLAGLTAAENVSLPLELDGVPAPAAARLRTGHVRRGPAASRRCAGCPPTPPRRTCSSPNAACGASRSGRRRSAGCSARRDR